MRKRNGTDDQPTGRRARRDRKRRDKAGQAGRARPSSSAGADLLAGARRAALWAITVLVTAADLMSFAGSYRGLLDWGLAHRLPLWESITFPFMVDVFIVVGELTVFVLVLEAARARSVEDFRHKLWHRLPGWGLALVGLAASVAGNVGDVWTAPVATRVTHAVPPLAAALSLAVALGMLKRIAMSYYRPVPRRAAVAEPAAAPVLPFHPHAPSARRAVARPAARPAGNTGDLSADDQALLDDARAMLDAGQTPQARPMGRKHFGVNTRQRRAQTLINQALAEQAGYAPAPPPRSSFDAFPATGAETVNPADEELEPANA